MDLSLPREAVPDASAFSTPSTRWWVCRFSSPKGLIAAAASGAAARSAGGYTIGDVEMLLRCAELLLWPAMLRSWAGHDGGHACMDEDEGAGAAALPSAFLDSWLTFLGGVHRSIKVLQPEDQAVKALANQLEISFRDMMDGVGLGGAGGGHQHLPSP